MQWHVPSEEGEGDYFHRAFAPGQALSEIADVAVINLTNEHRHKAALLEAAAVLVVNMVCDPNLLPIVKRRRRAGLRGIPALLAHHRSTDPRLDLMVDPIVKTNFIAK